MAASKKKITQLELRRLMNEQKKKLQGSLKKIESPLARYDKDGTLHCIVCETVVRSENVWTVHLNSKNHKQNILAKVKKKEAPVEVEPPPPAPPPALKRPPGPMPPPVAPKKLKGILKNATPSNVNKPKELLDEETVSPDAVSVNKLSQGIQDLRKPSSHDMDAEENDECDNTNLDTLPEGFFDDPKLDAKVRNVEYRDPIEEEWEQFQKEIREETNKAQQIIAEDQEEATTERQIDEIDEQIRNWSRVLTLEKKKEIVSTTLTEPKSQKSQEDLSDDEEFEEFLDWRSKKSFDKQLNRLVSS